MEILYLITASLIIFIISIYNAKREVKYKLSPKLGLITFFGGGIVSILFGLFFNSISSEPQAIDVYRGKTELKIEGYYQDSVFITTDSIVVYKNK